MASYVIASNSNNSGFAQCQILGQYLEHNTPDVSVQCVIKDKSEWNQFLDAVSRTYGFSAATTPIIYTLEGNLIGDAAAFIELCKTKYNLSLTLTKDTIKQRQKLNVQETDLRIRKQEGLTLGEKIEAYLEKKVKKNASSLITDSFYN